MAIQKTEAIVLKTTKLRETSLVITFFTRDFGKLQALAKGVRQAGSPWAGLYEPMNRLEIVFYEKFRTAIHLVTEATALDLRYQLRKNFGAVIYGYYLTEVLEKFSNVNEPDLDYWSLIESAYSCLTVAPAVVSCLFQLKLLRHSGFLPDLRRGKAGISLQGLPTPKDPKLIENFSSWLSQDWSEALKEALSTGVAEEGDLYLASLIAYKLDKKLRTRSFLETVSLNRYSSK